MFIEIVTTNSKLVKMLLQIYLDRCCLDSTSAFLLLLLPRFQKQKWQRR